MISLTKSTLALFLSRRKICRQFVAVAPFRFFIDVAASFVKSFFELFVFILPIKIVLILAAPQMPVMFDRFIPGVTRAEWAGILTALIVVLHITVLIQDWYLKQSAEKYARKFSVQHKKGRFTGDDFLISAYSGIVAARGSTLLLLALSLVIALVYLQFFLFLVLAVIVAALGTISLASASGKFRDAFMGGPPTVLGRVSNLIFISCFCFLVYAFVLSEQPPQFLQGVVSIILGRRLLGAINQKVSNLIWFSKKKAAIQKLFYRGHTALPQGAGRVVPFIDKMAQGSLASFASEVLNSLGIEGKADVSCKWVESPFQWMSLIQCHATIEDVQAIVILKVYEANKLRTAKNELEIYPELESEGLIPRFIGVSEVGGNQVHAFQLSDDWSFNRDRQAIAGLRTKLLPQKFEQSLVEEYCSVHPTLTDRLNSQVLSRLNLIADAEGIAQLNCLVEKLPFLSERIQSLPLSLTVPDPVLKQLTISDGENVRLLSLGDWRLEPLGFSLWASDCPEQLAAGLQSENTFAEGRDQLSLVEDIQLCRLLADLERHCKAGRLRAGTKLVGQIMDIVGAEKVESSRSLASV